MIQNRIPVLILRHPQEKKEALGTADLLQQNLSRCRLKTGLSWANLKKAIGSEDLSQYELPSEWGVLFLGGQLKFKPKSSESDQVIALKKNGTPDPESDAVLKSLKGLIVLDGTWSQSKTLWWRNAWLLKLRRLILIPAKPSLYGKKRKEPRRECLSTLEAVAITLSHMGEDPQVKDQLFEEFKKFLEK